eukprot:CAMPEP_0181371252 /NCGR_PEP_ID=MMETSP1106-20121128/13962_1 /TAXON_ID=81844 /ORGANISM="Mantoniella antarctica, Strain SL-175" /LENGTH=101 /DNA_ID=CAMNT_0023488303 /DNA_START=225 /DNA_END=526 /DNA_ORIENTATION=+
MNFVKRRAYTSGGWHEMSAPHSKRPKQQFSAALTPVYLVNMSMMPRYATPKGVSNARSWKMRFPSSSAVPLKGPANGPLRNDMLRGDTTNGDGGSIRSDAS